VTDIIPTHTVQKWGYERLSGAPHQCKRSSDIMELCCHSTVKLDNCVSVTYQVPSLEVHLKCALCGRDRYDDAARRSGSRMKAIEQGHHTDRRH